MNETNVLSGVHGTKGSVLVHGESPVLLDGLGSHHTHEFLDACAGEGIDVLVN
jgi:hypothetical protein